MSYTTEQLIEILDQELRATWKGERLLLSSTQRLANPVIAKALGAQKLSKVFAYQDFRAQVHQYQREHRVSGLVWRTCCFGGVSVHFPELHNQLIAIPSDKETLMAAKESVLAFWRQVTANLTLYQAKNKLQKISPQQIEQVAQRLEWAEVNAAQTELYLSLCWGNPQECYNQWAYPRSGCEQFIATVSKPSSIKI